MADDALEALGPLPGDPIHHVAAVGSAERAGMISVEPGVLLQSGGQSELEVLKGFAAPIAANRVGERLAVPGRAVEIDHDDAVPGAGKSLGVPAPIPGIRE